MIVENFNKSDDKFWKLFSINRVGIILASLPGGKIIEVNESYLKITEYTRDRVIDRTLEEIGWPLVGERHRMINRFFTNGGLIVDHEITIITASGQERMTLCSGTTTEFNGEQCVICTVQDVTEWRKAEQHYRETEEKFKTIYNISRVGISVTRLPKGEIMEINDTLLAMIGYTRDEVIGSVAGDVGWMEKGVCNRMVNTLTSNHTLDNYEIGFTTKSGQHGTGLFSGVVIELNGEKCGLVTVQDITERKKVEEMLRENEEKFRKLFDMSQAGIMLAHYPSGKFIEINDAYLKLIERTRDEIVGHTDQEVGWFDLADRQKMFDSFNQGNRAIRDYEVEYTKKSGKKGTMLISYDRIEINHEEYVLSAVTDITLRLEQEKRKTELLEQLKQANKDLESFSFSVSHDLRAPLRVIGGYIEMLQRKHRESLSEDEESLITRIRDQTRRMGNLIEDILTFSRQSNLELTKVPVDMNKLVQGVLNDYAIDLNGKHIILHELLPAVGDSHSLKQVFVNFIANALKYSAKKDNPVIEIGSYTEGNENIYFVKDNGAGFDMKYYDQLFQVFHRLHTQQEFEGSGVGLAIVNKVVTKHGGKVWAKGEVEKGATFYFSLPRE